MLDIIREFAGEQLGRDNAARVRGRHAAYFLGLASKAEPQIGGSDQELWFRALAADQDNFRTALRSFIDRGDAEATLSLAGALWQFWRSHGDIAEGWDWLRAGLALEGGSLPARAKALWGAAWLAYHHGDYEDAETLGEQLFALSRSATDPIVTRNAFTIRGIVAMAQGRFHDARTLFEEAVQLVRPLGQNWLLATSLLNLGTACVHVRDGARARSLLDEARAVYDRLGDQRFSARAAVQAGFAWMADGDNARAASLITTGLRSSLELEDVWGTTEGLEAMAAIRAAEGSSERAARTGGAAEVLRETMTVLPFASDRIWTERYMEEARASLDARAWQAAWDAGRALSLEDAVEDALAPRT
jgi:tetratricopeptide (TPR) repeat protein